MMKRPADFFFFFLFVQVSALTGISWCQFPSVAAVAAVGNSNTAAMTTAAPMETGNRRRKSIFMRKTQLPSRQPGQK